MRHASDTKRERYRADIIAALLIGAALAVMQVLVGGTRLVFSLPVYALLGVSAIVAALQLRKPRPAPDAVCLWAAAIFFGYVVLRALLSPVPYIARADLYSVLGGLIVYVFVACYFTDARWRMRLIIALLWIGVAHVAVGALQFKRGDNFMPIAFLQRFDYGRRASGFYICPNHLAGLLEVLGVFGASFVCWSRSPAWSKLLTGYATALCYVGLALTGSRGGYMSAIASLIVFAAASLIALRNAGKTALARIGGPVAAIGAALVVIAAVLILRNDFLGNRAQTVFDVHNARRDLWHAAFQQWKLAPIIGTGSATYLYYGREFRTARMQLDPVQVHNDYLQLLAEYGIIGVALLAVFLGAHVRRGWQTFRQLGSVRMSDSPRIASNKLALNIGALAAITALAVHSFVDFNLHIPANVLLMALVFGLVANDGARGSVETTERTAQRWRLLLPALGLLVIVQTARLWPAEWFTEKARTALRDRKGAQALQFAQRALSYERANPALFLYEGRARVLLGDSMADRRARNSFYRAALDSFADGRRLAPRDVTLAVEMALTYDALGRYAEAEWIFTDATKLDPHSDALRGYYAAHIERWRSAVATQFEPSAYGRALPAE